MDFHFMFDHAEQYSVFEEIINESSIVIDDWHEQYYSNFEHQSTIGPFDDQYSNFEHQSTIGPLDDQYSNFEHQSTIGPLDDQYSNLKKRKFIDTDIDDTVFGYYDINKDLNDVYNLFEEVDCYDKYLINSLMYDYHKRICLDIKKNVTRYRKKVDKTTLYNERKKSKSIILNRKLNSLCKNNICLDSVIIKYHNYINVSKLTRESNLINKKK